MSMRILGLDGLDLGLAEKWGLYHLLGRHYGELEVPISKRYGHPHSPDVWASFLTGHWYDTLRFTRPYGLHRILDLMYWLRKTLGTSLGLGKLGEEIYSSTINQFPKLKHHIFDMDMYNVPYVNYDGRGLRIIQGFVNSKQGTAEAKERSIEETWVMLRMLLSDRLGDVDAFFKEHDGFAFVGFPDLMQHFTNREDEAVAIYTLLNAWVRDMDDLLIISDHGFNLDTKLHSDVGYWSSNFDLGFTPVKITDFHPYLTRKKMEIIP